MKGFALDEHGDIVIQNGEIQLLHGSSLTAQTVKSVLGTQKGEWFLNINEGINHRNILGKKVAMPGDNESSQYATYIGEIERLKQASATAAENMTELNEKLARRLDGVK